MLLGIDVLQRDRFAPLAGKRVGLLTGPSGVDRTLRSTYRILWGAPEVDLVALFSPEHGFTAAAADGVLLDSTIDPVTGLPIFSLYGETMRPSPEMLAHVDVIVFDIQDIGIRYYTYIWTLTHVLEAAGEHGIDVMVLDRPNPLGGLTVTGAPMEEAFRSLVGRFPVPTIHGMTVGELAQMVNARWNPTPAKLTVIACEGWSRAMTWEQTGLSWVPTSPAIPHISTVNQYAGACLLEGTNLSEGRGTALPFEIAGAPFLDSLHLAEHLNWLNLSGVYFRPHVFTPTASKWKGETCFGVQVHVMDRTFSPITVWLHLIREIRRIVPEHFKWTPPFNVHPHFDLLTGSDHARHAIDAGKSVDKITAGWDTFCDNFRQQRTPFLLYR